MNDHEIAEVVRRFAAARAGIPYPEGEGHVYYEAGQAFEDMINILNAPRCGNRGPGSPWRAPCEREEGHLDAHRHQELCWTETEWWDGSSDVVLREGDYTTPWNRAEYDAETCKCGENKLDRRYDGMCWKCGTEAKQTKEIA
jgi:hypothetical protein